MPKCPPLSLASSASTKLTLTATSTSKWGETRLRVALVLDNTGSMADSGKMMAMQSATKSLLTQLQTAVTNPGDVYVSIIPFVKDVNLGGANWNSDWIYWGTVAQDPSLSDNNSWDANNGTCSAEQLFDAQLVPRQVDVLALGLQQPEQLHERGRLLAVGLQ